MRAPSPGDRRKFLAAATKALRFKVEKGADVSVELADIQERRREALMMIVERVENYTGADDAPIVSAKDLWDRGDTSVADEVGDYAALLLGVSEEDAKNSGGSPASPQQATQHSPAIAESVSENTLRLPATAMAAVTPPISI